ncbi:MAG: PAS domain S-box protein, partial [Pseudomonadota bacterium]
MDLDENQLRDENERLRQKLAEYETIFNASPIMFWYKDAHNRTLRINKAAAELEGTTPEEIEGKRAEDLYPEAQAAAFYADDLEVINHPDAPKLNILEPHTAPGTGETRWLRVGKVATRNSRGEVDGLVAFALDVTSEQQAVKALRDKEKQQADILNNTSSIVYINDLEGRYLYLNQAYEKLFNAKYEELIGETAHRIFPPETVEALFLNNLKVIERDTVLEFEETIPYAGDEHAYLSIKFPLKDSAGKTYAVCGISTDISERKRNQEALQLSEHRLAEAQAVAMMGSFEGIVGKNEIWWSAQLYTLFGLDPASFIPTASSFYALLHPDDSREYSAALRHALATEGKLRREYRGKHINGEWRYFETNASAKKDAATNRIILSGTVQDVTARKLADIELSNLRHFLSNLVNSIGDAVIATDNEGTITLMNPVAEGLTGWPEEESIGRYLSEVFNIVNAKTLEVCENPVQKVITSGKVVGLANHTLLISREGQEYQIADSAAPIQDQNNNITGVVMVFRDVTDEYRMLEAVKESETSLNTAQKIARLGSWNWDLRENHLQWSDMMYEIYGLEKGEPPATERIRELIVEEDLPTFDNAFNLLDEAEIVDSFEYRIIRPDGQLRHLFVKTLTLLDGAEQLQKLSGVIQDVTEQKQIERELREQKQFNDSLIETLPGIFYLNEIADGHSRLIRWNNNLAKTLGFSEEDLHDKQTFEFFDETNTPKIKKAIELMIEQGEANVEA